VGGRDSRLVRDGGWSSGLSGGVALAAGRGGGGGDAVVALRMKRSVYTYAHSQKGGSEGAYMHGALYCIAIRRACAYCYYPPTKRFFL
jgi:hypothetical protein